MMNSFEREGRALAELVRRGYTVIAERETVIATKDGMVEWGATPANVLQSIDPVAIEKINREGQEAAPVTHHHHEGRVFSTDVGTPLVKGMPGHPDNEMGM